MKDATIRLINNKGLKYGQMVASEKNYWLKKPVLFFNASITLKMIGQVP